MDSVKLNLFIITTLGILFFVGIWLLHLLWMMPLENVAISWLISGEITAYSTKWSFMVKMVIIYAFLLALFLVFLFYALHTKKEYITLYSRYGSYKIKTENAPNFIAILVIIALISVDMYLYDVLTFNISRTFFFFNFPFIIIYIVIVFALFIADIYKYGRS